MSGANASPAATDPAPMSKTKARAAARAANLSAGLGPAGVKRFPYIASVIRSVKSKHANLERIDSDFGLVKAVVDIVEKSSKPAAKPASMALGSVVAELHKRGGEWQAVDQGRVRGVLARIVQLGHLATGTVTVVDPRSGSPDLKGPARQTAVVQLAADASAVVAQRHREAAVAVGLEVLPELDHVRSMQLGEAGGGAALLALNRSVAEAARHWRPSARNTADVRELVARIEVLARAAVKGGHVTARVFGSRAYGLCCDASDVDVTVSVTGAAVDARAFFKSLARVMWPAAGFVRVVDVSHARVPIVKFEYVASSGARLEGDVSLNGSKGLAKSRLVATYLEADPRVRDVLGAVKLWATRREILSSNTLNSFGLLMMGVAFLVERQVVPPLQLLSTARMGAQAWERLARLRRNPYEIAMLYPGSASAPSSPTEPLSPAGGGALCLQRGCALPEWPVEGTRAYFLNGRELGQWRSPNRESPAELLFALFRHYGFEFDPAAHAVSPRLGSMAIPRASLCQLPPLVTGVAPEEQPNKWREAVRPLAIEDPFDLAVNCGRAAPPEWVAGFLWEMRRAAWALTPGAVLAPVERLLLPPDAAIYSGPVVWASAYRCAIGDVVYDAAAVSARTVDLERLENAQARLAARNQIRRVIAGAHAKGASRPRQMFHQSL
ncbi:hypothetical protein GGI04_002392 [Coemansia thaxteri]|nr:hypothetical protein GGI04_002392 [Coemansia thaxteri]KAJ2471627.1 hypothetical protein GGI02_002146 [Coemansia sp. RSA 2322]